MATNHDKEAPKNPGGRPSKFTPEVREKIIHALSRGNFLSTACAYARVNYRTFRGWMRQGEQDLAEGKETDFSQFVQDVEGAQADAEVEIVDVIRTSMANQVFAAIEFLKLRQRDKWGKEARDAQKDDDFDPTTMTDEDLENLAGGA